MSHSVTTCVLEDPAFTVIVKSTVAPWQEFKSCSVTESTYVPGIVKSTCMYQSPIKGEISASPANGGAVVFWSIIDQV